MRAASDQRLASATDATLVRVGTFGGVSAFPLAIAERLGLAAAHGLDLVVTRTTDSTSLRDDLLAGRIDVAHAAPDNAIAWADEQAAGGSAVPTGVAVWLAGSNGPIALVARDATGIAALRGARIGVDAPTAGFAPILIRLLATAGLATHDVELVALGATRARHAALLEGRIEASMLTLPWSAVAVAAGCRQLATHDAVTPGLLTSAAIVRRDWLLADAAVTARYRSMLAEALAWLREPASRTSAVAWLAADLGIDDPIARAVVTAMGDPAMGWPASPDPGARALEQVVGLRASMGRPALRDAPAYLALP